MTHSTLEKDYRWAMIAPSAFLSNAREYLYREYFKNYNELSGKHVSDAMDILNRLGSQVLHEQLYG